MVANYDYQSLVQAIKDRGGFCEVQCDHNNEERVVCASRITPTGALAGNSFYVSFCNQSNRWVLSTWSPSHYAFYRATSEVVADVCIEVLGLSGTPISSLPLIILNKHNLVELSADH